MSGRADILALASTIGLSTMDAIMLDRYYTEALIALAHTDVQLDARIVPVTAGEPRYAIGAFAPDTVKIAAAFFGTREITESPQISLEAASRAWQTDTAAAPIAFVTEHEDHHVMRLYPIPNTTSAGAVLAPDPFGLNYPLDQLVVLIGDDDESAAPWLDLPLALSLIARELARASEHRDPQVVEMATRLGTAARALGGLP